MKVLKKISSIALIGLIVAGITEPIKSNAQELVPIIQSQTLMNEMPNDMFRLDKSDIIMEDETELSVVEGDTVRYFQSKEDKQDYINARDGKLRYGEYAVATVVDSTDKDMLWIGFHSMTPSWSKARSYVTSENKTYSASGNYTYKGFNVDIGFSYSKGVAIEYPADASRWSKLGTWGDFTFQHVKYTYYYQGVPTGKVTYGASKVVRNHYIET